MLLLTACGQQNELTIATGYEGGSYYDYGTLFSEAMESDANIAVQIQETPGSWSNLDLLNGRIADLALAQADVVAEAAADNEREVKYHVLGSVYREVMMVMVPADSNIVSADDLKGFRIAVGEEGSATAAWADRIRKYALIREEDLSYVELPASEALNALKAGTVDAIFYISKSDNPKLLDFINENGIRLLDIPQNMIDFASEEYAFLEDLSIPAGTYPGQTGSIHTIGVPALLLASDSLDVNTEQQIVQTINSHDDLGPLENCAISEEETPSRTTPCVKLDQFMTLAVAVLCLLLGMFLRKKISFLVHFCIPAPVIGGLIFAIISCILYATGLVEISFNESFKDIFMMMFFTSVGFEADLKAIKTGGKGLVILVVLVTVLIVLQNGLSIGLSLLIGQSPLLGMTTGSIPMLGGHGVSGAFGPILEGMGLEGATTVCIAAATFGLLCGSLMGGPLGEHLIEKKDLVKTAVPVVESDKEDKTEKKTIRNRAFGPYMVAMCHLAFAMGVGSILTLALQSLGLTVPGYIGGMIIAAIMRNIGERSPNLEIPMKELRGIGDISLSFFLGIAMITLKLWQLADLAVPLIILLVGQVVLMFLYARFIAFNALGRDYDAAVITSGLCGFGMGATPNAMANMQAVTGKYVPSAKAFLIVPLAGAMFNDILNSGLLTLILNILK